MRKDTIKIYEAFDTKKTDEFFDSLVAIVAKHKIVFDRYIALSFVDEILKYRSEDFILGHSDDFFAEEIQSYLNAINDNNEERIARQVVGLIVSLSSYMLLEDACPVCEQSNMRLLSDYQDGKIYEFCDECFYTTLDGKFIQLEKELYPAKKEGVSYYLNNKRLKKRLSLGAVEH